MIERLDDGTASTVAKQVANDYGRQLGAEIGVAGDEGYGGAAMAVATSMMSKGLGASTVASENRIVARFCPMCATPQEEPEILKSLDQGIVQGLLESAAARPVTVEVHHS